MSVVTTNLSLVRGDTDTLTVTVSGLGASGLNAYNDIRFTAKRDIGDADSAATISKALASGITIATVGDAVTDGVLSIAIAPTDTAALPTGSSSTLQYDVRLYDAAGDAYTVAQGVITVSPTATQATS
jgi:hypothetical protein